MKSIVILFTALMIVCISGMIYFSGDDPIFSLFSTASIMVTLGGTYLIERKKEKDA
ncbi:hypothetical protein G5B37_01135 [Rasiella rasia]|uniref:Uncharacterized protein n=1 Tax=Rasiella rasia TaxID=2744027 RepID=A0A6G6GI71_9FLAO|nr:hypothetical protein [Rasiella rasia]QIE58217.1 hypothetical protein G5B37_01135 [Rasiella rasia]